MADNTSSTAANKETTADNLLQLPSDVLRKVAAFTFAAPSKKSCSIEYDGQKKRRDALEGSRHARALHRTGCAPQTGTGREHAPVPV